MEFGSVVFLLRFLPIFLICYYLVPGRMKNFVLLLGNLCFYAWGMPVYVLLMLVVLSSDYCYGLLIEKNQKKKLSGILLGNALFFDIVLLIVFGYTDFGLELINRMFGTQFEGPGFPIPLGLTVFLFQTMSYVVDVYRGEVKAQRNYLDLAVYVTMFPQLLGGPIVQYNKVQPCLRERKVDVCQISKGMKRFCVGLAKKVLIADAAMGLWETIHGLPSLSLANAWLGILIYGLGLYYMFSGYADMAIGLGACVGFDYPENFRHPFAATSMTDFVKRWNVTLMAWMRKYFYAPLFDKRKGIVGQVFGVIFVWMLIGLWYGPDLTFALWGLWMAAFYILEKLIWNKVQVILPRVMNWIFTMFIVFVGLVFFAAKDLEEVWPYALAMFGQGSGELIDDHFWYIMIEYFPLVLAGILFATPYIYLMVQKMSTSRRVMFMALYRFGEKTIPPILLIMSLVKIAG